MRNKCSITKRVLILFLIVITVILIFTTSIYAYYRKGWLPLQDIVKTGIADYIETIKDNVDSVTVNCIFTNGEDFEIKKSNRQYIYALAEIWDLKVYLPRLIYSDTNIKQGGHGPICYHIYMKNGDVHEIIAYDTRERFNSTYCYISVDGKQYIAADWRYKTLASIAERAVTE